MYRGSFLNVCDFFPIFVRQMSNECCAKDLELGEVFKRFLRDPRFLRTMKKLVCVAGGFVGVRAREGEFREIR